MPRKTASKTENTELNETEKPVVEKKTTTRKASTTKSTSKASEASTSKTKSTKSSSTKASTSKKTETKKTSSSKRTTRPSSTKATKKTATSRSTTRKKKLSADEITSTTNLTQKIEVIEYYDLPYRYNQTVVRVLAQTPTTLFIYWDISDVDRANFVKQYGEDFFNNTKPVLVIHNNTMHYSFEIEIDDFANSWYLHVKNSNCKYKVELGRRPITHEIVIPNNYVYISSSNAMDAPNDHILFDKLQQNVFFKNVKTNVVTEKNILTISHLINMGKLYNIYELYKKMYKDEFNCDDFGTNLASSQSSSSFI